MPEHNHKMGKRDDLPHFVRSSWEANIARYLRYIGQEYEYEPDIFYFPGVKNGAVNYKPDFKIGENHYIEVKGNMTSRDRTKLKRMAKFYPHVRIDVIDKNAYKEIEKQYGHLIPNWEFPVKKPRNVLKEKKKKAKEYLEERGYAVLEAANTEEFEADFYACNPREHLLVIVLYVEESEQWVQDDRVQALFDLEVPDDIHKIAMVYKKGRKEPDIHDIKLTL